MTLQEAIKSGMPFRRPKDPVWRIYREFQSPGCYEGIMSTGWSAEADKDYKSANGFDGADVLATDWETKPREIKVYIDAAGDLTKHPQPGQKPIIFREVTK